MDVADPGVDNGIMAICGYWEPADVFGLGAGSGVVSVTAGGWHTCALLDSGAVKCWGFDYYGQVGDGAGDDPQESRPVDVVGLGTGSGGIAITAGAYHTCVLLDSGAVRCWGSDYYGQVGDGADDNANKYTPVDVFGLGAGSGVIAITAGAYHTCVLLDSGAAKCWGDDYYGQVGDGADDNANEYAPVDVVDLGAGSGIVAIAAGNNHTCALLDSGAVKCWGRDYYGQLGDGADDNANEYAPVDVVGLPGLP
jgi:alpha-tubulin suppressor-like RCC1 family protein